MHKRTLGIVGTLIVHLALPVYLLWPRDAVPPPPPPAKKGAVEVKLIPMSAVEETKIKGPEPGIDGAPDPRICSAQDKEYEGIGIIHQMGTWLITSAPAAYPAYRAGARVGDMIVELYQEEGGSPYMRLHVNRHGVHFKFRIKKEKICFNESK